MFILHFLSISKRKLNQYIFLVSCIWYDENQTNKSYWRDLMHLHFLSLYSVSIDNLCTALHIRIHEISLDIQHHAKEPKLPLSPITKKSVLTDRKRQKLTSAYLIGAHTIYIEVKGLEMIIYIHLLQGHHPQMN